MASAGNYDKTILIVEDDESSLVALSALVESVGYQSVCVATAKEAVKYLYNFTLPDMMLLDLQLPDKGGDELARELHANPLFRDIPIIVISGHVDASSTTIRGVRAVFEKPIDNAQLLTTIATFVK